MTNAEIKNKLKESLHSKTEITLNYSGKNLIGNGSTPIQLIGTVTYIQGDYLTFKRTKEGDDITLSTKHIKIPSINKEEKEHKDLKEKVAILV